MRRICPTGSKQWPGHWDGERLTGSKLAEALEDRASFRRFCGFAAHEATPERTAFVRFRRTLVAHDLAGIVRGCHSAAQGARHHIKTGMLVSEIAALGAGWSLRTADGKSIAATAVSILDADLIALDFATVVPAGARVHFGWGNARTAIGNAPGQGNALYDSAGFPAWTAAVGVAIGPPGSQPPRSCRRPSQPKPQIDRRM